MTFQKGGIKEPRAVQIGHTVTSDHPVVKTLDGKEVPIKSHRVCMFAMDRAGSLHYANSPASKAQLVGEVAAGKLLPHIYVAWTGDQWTDLFRVDLELGDEVEALMRGLGFAPDGGAIKIGKTKWAPAS